jgi:hypothetical protein
MLEGASKRSPALPEISVSWPMINNSIMSFVVTVALLHLLHFSRLSAANDPQIAAEFWSTPEEIIPVMVMNDRYIGHANLLRYKDRIVACSVAHVAQGIMNGTFGILPEDESEGTLIIEGSSNVFGSVSPLRHVPETIQCADFTDKVSPAEKETLSNRTGYPVRTFGADLNPYPVKQVKVNDLRMKAGHISCNATYQPQPSLIGVPSNALSLYCRDIVTYGASGSLLLTTVDGIDYAVGMTFGGNSSNDAPLNQLMNAIIGSPDNTGYGVGIPFDIRR